MHFRIIDASELCLGEFKSNSRRRLIIIWDVNYFFYRTEENEEWIFINFKNSRTVHLVCKQLITASSLVQL